MRVPAALAFLASAWCASHASQRRTELVWAPILDQWTQSQLESFRQNPLGLPDFPIGQTRAETQDKIARALVVVHGKGFRVLDLEFPLARAQLDPVYARAWPPGAPGRPPLWDSTLSGLADCGEDWLRALAAFNRAHPADPFRLRLRVPAHARDLYAVYRTLRPYAARLPAEDWRAGKVRSRFPGLPLDPCFEIPGPSDPCYASSPVPGSFYRARGTRGTYSTTVANLANPAIREAIAGYTSLLIATARDMLGSGTVIEEVSLALDAGWETSLFIDDDGGVASFGDSLFAPDSSLAWKAAFYRARERHLRAAIAAFAAAVHAERNRDGTPIRAGVFQQAHHLDGRSRGTFDLYSLLAGTGVDVLHHTHPPVGDEGWSLAWAAYSASVASALGIRFDTEFTWPHFGGPQLLLWKQEYLTTRNAEAFLAQARAGLGYGAAAIVFANWSMHDLCRPPKAIPWQAVAGSAEGLPDTAWQLSPGGLLDAAAFPSSRYAVYISTLGRIQCEEAKAADAASPQGCDVRTYQAWFGELGLRGLAPGRGPLATERIDILTDGMIRDGKAAWDRYERIYLPYQTSRSVDGEVLARLKALPREVRDRFRHQRLPGIAAEEGFSEWELGIASSGAGQTKPP